jgi:hypothetical protein
MKTKQGGHPFAFSASMQSAIRFSRWRLVVQSISTVGRSDLGPDEADEDEEDEEDEELPPLLLLPPLPLPLLPLLPLLPPLLLLPQLPPPLLLLPLPLLLPPSRTAAVSSPQKLLAKQNPLLHNEQSIEK